MHAGEIGCLDTDGAAAFLAAKLTDIEHGLVGVDVHLRLLVGEQDLHVHPLVQRVVDRGAVARTVVELPRGDAVVDGLVLGGIRIAALVDSADGSTGIVTVLGIDVRVDAGTRIEDKWLDVEPFTVGDITAGNYVEVRGMDTGAEVVATLIEREDGDDDDDDGEEDD